MTTKNLLVDVNNLAFAIRHASMKPVSNRSKKEEFATEYIFLQMIKSTLSHARKFSCNALVIASDSKNIWRTDIYPMYKGKGDKVEDVYYKETIEAAKRYQQFFRDNSAAMVISVDRCEADDIIAVWCQESDVKNIILSSDRDFVQLLNENTELYSIQQRTFREVPEGTTADYQLFLKCFRGDLQSDNITSAYPRLRETLIKKAYTDDFELLNLLETVLPSGEKVGDLFERNVTLIDLTQQPCMYRKMIEMAINTYSHGSYSEFKAIKALYEFGVKKDSDFLHGYAPLLGRRPTFKTEERK